jgi:glucose uptake protein
VYQPETYIVALSFMIVTMLCWGSWANTIKLCPLYHFQLFYWDYVGGLVLGALAWGLTLGSMGATGKPLLADLAAMNTNHFLLALAGGVTFNLANLLLVAAIDIAGLAVAFPIGIGLALVVGAVSSYLITPHGNPWMLFGGIALVVAAIVLDAGAYRLREREHAATTRRGVVLSLVAGLLMGVFYPFVSKAMSGGQALGPYSTAFVFSLGVLACSIPVNYLFMRRPLDGGASVSMRSFAKAPLSWHMCGLAGGLIWCTGAVLNFVASRTQMVGPAVSYSIGQGATMVSAFWGVFVWREFALAPKDSKRLIAWMFISFILGLTSIALAPLL